MFFWSSAPALDALEAISLDMELEIEELKQIISLAKQAQFQNQDAKVEPLLNEIDAILSEDRTQKVIIFTEFVATQTYLQPVLRQTLCHQRSSLRRSAHHRSCREWKQRRYWLLSASPSAAPEPC